MPEHALAGVAETLLRAALSFALSIARPAVISAAQSVLIIMAAPVAAQAKSDSGPPANDEAVRAEINLMRSDPSGYAAKLRAYRTGIGADKIWRGPGRPNGVITHEGTAAVDEAIAALEASPPLPMLADEPRLSAAARAHAAEQSRTGAIGHTSADGTTLAARIRQGQVIYGAIAETISYGQNSPEDVVRQLLVDDDVPSRGHRLILLDAQFRFIGVGCATHVVYRYLCVQDYSSISLPK